MVRVLVVAGGNSDERTVSLRSGEAVITALKLGGYDASLLDSALGFDQILPELRRADIVFIALHGAGGEDGILQAQLEEQSIHYIGSDSHASAICFNKNVYGSLLQRHGFRVPATELVNKDAFDSSLLPRAPFVLKPNTGGSSIDTLIARHPSQTNMQHVDELFKRHGRMLLQELIVGCEITVAILGDQALPVIEIVPPANQDFDYENKYNGQSSELCPPENVSSAKQKEAQSVALRVHSLVGCRDMSRTDMILSSDAELFILETNTIPGLTNQSLLPKAAATAGYDMVALVTFLVEQALARTS